MLRRLLVISFLLVPSIASAQSDLHVPTPSAGPVFADLSPGAHNRAVLETVRAIVRRFVNQLDEIDPVG